jgi:hypothetical protein
MPKRPRGILNADSHVLRANVAFQVTSASGLSPPLDELGEFDNDR